MTDLRQLWEKGLTHLPGIMRPQDVKFVLED